MNQHEQQFLKEFLDQLIQTQTVSKDPDAESMIKKAASQQPDTVYLLVQKACIQQQGLIKAQEQIEQLKTELASLKTDESNASSDSRGSISDFLTGKSSKNTQGANQTPSQQTATSAPPASGNSFLGNFLGNAATTAAGVAGGAFLFEGLKGLFGGGHAQAASSSSSQGFFSGAANESSPVDNGTNNMDGIGNFFDNSLNEGTSESFMDNDNDVLLDEDAL